MSDEELAEAAFEYAAAFADLAKLARADGDTRDAEALVDSVEDAYDLELADGVLNREGIQREAGFDPYSVDPDLAGDDRDDRGPELTLVLSTVSGETRRLRIREAAEPGVPFAVEESEWTGCAFRPVGREQLDRVEIDGDVWHEADVVDGAAETEAGP